jgi:4-oxalocrotonate tautomerase
MPIITIKIAKGRSIEQKRKLVNSVTNTIVTELDIEKELITVLIDEYERENWSTAGTLHSDKFVAVQDK